MVTSGSPTHTAIRSGSWFDAATWDAGAIPADDARALIPPATTVTYDGASAARIAWINVEGSLQFSTSQSSQLFIDTLYVDADGELTIGTLLDPVRANVTIDIAITNDGDIDVTGDPTLLSRGVVAFGRVRMHGHRKTTHLKAAVDPRAGDQQLQLADIPEGWQIGDTLVLTGTRYSGWKWDNDIRAVRYHGTQDEVLTITSLNGSTVGVSPQLQFDHLTPRADLKASVANFTRNIAIRTEDPETAAVHQRGHVVFMHHDDVDVRYVELHELGRTNKEVPSFEAADIATVTSTSNVRGRYPIHVHRAGVGNPRTPALVVGVAVFGSPGWGITHHDSNMVVHNSATFNTFGAGIVAETGNEIGSWTDNIAIKAEGNSAFNPKNGNDREEFDMGRSGAGFWFQGRMVRSVGNVAASVNHGYAYLHRGAGMLGFPATAFMLPEALRRDRDSSPDDAPIFNFAENEAFASTVGVYVVKANPNQQHDIRTVMEDFTAWEVRAGAAMEYTSHYLLRNFDLIGATPESFRDPDFGIDFGTNTTDMVVNGASIVGFPVGIGLGKDFTDESTPPSVNQYAIIDAVFQDVDEQYGSFDPSIDHVLSSSELVPGRFSVLLNNGQPFEYNSPATSAGSGVSYIGTKTDSIGESPIPPGTDNLGTAAADMIAICEQDGYRRATNGDPYAIVEEYFSDHATGRIHKYGLKTRFGGDMENFLGNRFHAWADCFEAGAINLASQPPTARNDRLDVTREIPATIAVLANDSDPEDEPLFVDGVVQSRHGEVFVEADQSLTYVPDFDFVGDDSFYYWATDGQGNYSPADVTVTVRGEPIVDQLFEDGFE